MSKRKITNLLNVKFEPFDNYGTPIPGMNWHKISYSKETGQGSYILKMEPGAKSLPHKHINYEEFLVLDGELIDPDNTIFKKGDFKTLLYLCKFSGLPGMFDLLYKIKRGYF